MADLYQISLRSTIQYFTAVCTIYRTTQNQQENVVIPDSIAYIHRIVGSLGFDDPLASSANGHACLQRIGMFVCNAAALVLLALVYSAIQPDETTNQPY